MKPSIKTFLLWLLIAVLPLHAVAATTGMSCGPVHQKAMQVSFADKAHHDYVAAHSHHHGDANEMSAVSADSPATTDASSGTSHSHSTCNSCTTTCIGAAGPPSAFNPTPAFIGAEMVVVSPAPLAAGIIPGGLERPPRRTFA